MSKKSISYEEASTELQQIAEKLEKEDVNIDELSGLVKKGKELLKVCEKKLRKTEEELNNE